MPDRSVSIATPDGEMAGFLAFPAGDGPFPAVVVAQEAFGVNEHIREVCRRFAAEGYVALAPELYHRDGRGIVADYSDFESARSHLQELTNDRLEADLSISLEWLRREPHPGSSPVSIVGFCVGGFVAFLAACRTTVDSAVCFYGGGIVRPRPGAKLTPLLGEAERIRCPVLALFGEEDPSIPLEDVAAIRDRLDSLGKQSEVVTYRGAGHGFFCDRRDSFRPEAAADAWKRTLAWIAGISGAST